MSKDNFVLDLLEDITFTKRILASKLQGSIFRSNGEDDPAGLCDGGDYIQEIQIRTENVRGDIYLSIKPWERGEWWSGTITWEEFFNLLMQMIKNSDKFEHHEH